MVPVALLILMVRVPYIATRWGDGLLELMASNAPAFRGGVFRMHIPYQDLVHYQGRQASGVTQFRLLLEILN